MFSRQKTPGGGEQQQEIIDNEVCKPLIFEAGRLKKFEKCWRKITSDPNIIDIALHCHFEIDINNIEYKESHNWSTNVNEIECKIIEQEIEKLLALKVIKKVDHQKGEFISPIFTRPKKDGEHRMILNLKNLNKFIKCHHFKMDCFESALTLVSKNCYMASIDIRHAYYSVPIAEELQKYLRFEWKGNIFQYVCLPNGLCCAPLLFTKLLKPVYAALRKLGHKNSGYIDDSLLVAEQYQKCKKNVEDTVELFENLGFIKHDKKSVLEPTQNITYLGNDVNSVEMIVTLPHNKVQKLILACSELYSKTSCIIRTVAHVLGLMVSTFSAVEYGPLFYRNIEREKIAALRLFQGDFNSKMFISDAMKQDLQWWIKNLSSQKRHINHGNPDYVITTDASLVGWGAECIGEQIQGRWLVEESSKHINVLELKAVYFAIKAFCREKRNIHVQIKCDNTTAICYLNSKGGVKSVELNDLAKAIWLWCIERDIWVSATHVPGIQNEVDCLSRKFNDNVEWMLDISIFRKITEYWGTPEIDMFASRINRQVQRFASWHPDPEAEIIDSMSTSWSNVFLYAFPPFSMVGRCLQKILQDTAECILIAPAWETQNYYPMLMNMLIDYPVMLPQEDILSIVNTGKIHPLMNKLRLIACRISGDPSKTRTFQLSLPILFSHHGEIVRKNNICHILTVGPDFVMTDRVIQFKQI